MEARRYHLEQAEDCLELARLMSDPQRGPHLAFRGWAAFRAGLRAWFDGGFPLDRSPEVDSSALPMPPKSRRLGDGAE
jgi:hypothetical protein